MKRNTFYALSIPALLVVAGLTGMSSRVVTLAKQAQPQLQQAVKTQQATTDAETQDDGVNGTAVDNENGTETEDGAQNGMNEAATLSEADEAAALANQVKISAEQAKSAALAANHGANVSKVELGNENGTIIYSIELNNGADVKVDANSATVLSTDTTWDKGNEMDQADGNEADHDNVQEEHNSQPDDANEKPGVEDPAK